jgi:hypothetical protein
VNASNARVKKLLGLQGMQEYVLRCMTWNKMCHTNEWNGTKFKCWRIGATSIHVILVDIKSSCFTMGMSPSKFG